MTSGGGASSGTASRANGYPKGPLLRPTPAWRVAVFLTGNLIAYAFVCAFMHYVSSGNWFSVTAADYQHWTRRSLGEMLLTPLSIFTHPWMVLVAGLLLAAVVIVPLLIACLYHSRVSALFLICVAVLAHAPVLTLVLATGCVLVAATDLRRRNPPLALLLGLLPVQVYLYLSAGPPGIVLMPMQLLALRSFFVVVVGFGALVAGGMVLLIAHWVRYRPGVIWPVLGVLAALPVWVFHQKIGADELAFALLAADLTPSETVFADELYARDPGSPDGVLAPTEIARVRGLLEQRKADWVDRCDAFLRRHPDSRRAPAVLWIKGIALDTQVSIRAMYDGRLRYYDSFPLADSADTWRQLTTRFPDDPRAGVGHLRLGQLAGRVGAVEEARRHLDAAVDVLSELPAAAPAPDAAATWTQVFQAFRQWPSREYLQAVAMEADKLRWLIQVNRVESDPTSTATFREFVALDRRRYSREGFSREVARLAERFVDTDFADNLHLVEAMSHSDVYTRARKLLELEDESDLDASIEANFELGRLALQAAHDEGLSRLLARPERYFSRVRDAQANPWQRRAEAYLQAIRAQEQAPP